MRAHGLVSRYAEGKVQVLLDDVRFRVGLRLDGWKILLVVGEQVVR